MRLPDFPAVSDALDAHNFCACSALNNQEEGAMMVVFPVESDLALEAKDRPERDFGGSADDHVACGRVRL